MTIREDRWTVERRTGGREREGREKERGDGEEYLVEGREGERLEVKGRTLKHRKVGI